MNHSFSEEAMAEAKQQLKACCTHRLGNKDAPRRPVSISYNSARDRATYFTWTAFGGAIPSTPLSISGTKAPFKWELSFSIPISVSQSGENCVLECPNGSHITRELQFPRFPRERGWPESLYICSVGGSLRMNSHDSSSFLILLAVFSIFSPEAHTHCRYLLSGPHVDCKENFCGLLTGMCLFSCSSAK